MKKLLISLFAASLLLAACNTDDGNVDDSKEKESQLTEETPGKETDVDENTDVADDVATETPKTEQPADEGTVSEVNIYVPDANAEKIELKETIQYSNSEGPLPEFILEKLNLMDYYNSHQVSADEKTITIDFKEALQTSNLVQGSAGGAMFAGQIYASFFESMDKLESIQLRIEGKEVDLDHLSFSGAVTREDYLAAYPEVQ